MKHYGTFLFVCVWFAASAQGNREPKMAALYVPGYYINSKNDTVRGKVQINPKDPTDFYNKFAFISGRSKKPKILSTGQTKAYGFQSRHFVVLSFDGRKFFAEKLTLGRLRFYELQFNGKVHGSPGVESVYFIRDTYAEGDNKNLIEPRKVSHKFYKKSLKPYLQEQPSLWSDLDKYVFDREIIIETINEFNRHYISVGN